MKTLGKYQNGIELEIKLSKLRASSIYYIKKGSLGNYIGINFGELGEEEIFVNEKDYETAKNIMDEA